MIARTGTLAEKLGTTVHLSPLLAKAARLGLGNSTSLASLAIQRGCTHYRSYRSPVNTGFPDISRNQLSDEELAVGLLSPNWPYDPTLIRIGAQLLSGEHCNPETLSRLARQERCGPVLRYIATCGARTEPWSSFWKNLLDHTGAVRLPAADTMPHPSRFRAETGIPNPHRPGLPLQRWLRPSSTRP